MLLVLLLLLLLLVLRHRSRRALNCWCDCRLSRVTLMLMTLLDICRGGGAGPHLVVPGVGPARAHVVPLVGILLLPGGCLPGPLACRWSRSPFACCCSGSGLRSLSTRLFGFRRTGHAVPGVLAVLFVLRRPDR